MKTLLNNLMKFLKSQEKLIIGTNDIDVSNGGDRVSVYEIINSLKLDEEFEYYGKQKSKYKNNDHIITNVYDNYGVIGVDCENNLVYPLVRVMAICIYTRNKLVIKINNGRNYGTINMLVILINKFLENLKMNDYIKLSDNLDVNKVIIVSTREYYEEKLKEISVPCSYYSIDKPIVIITDRNKVKYLDDCNVISTFELDNGIRVNSIGEGIDYVNKNHETSKVILLSNNEEECIKFMNCCKASLVCVNVISNNITMPNFNQMDFLFVKSMISVK